MITIIMPQFPDIKNRSGLLQKNNKRRVARNELKGTDDFQDTDRRAYYR